MGRDDRCVIIGAGPAGLTAAYELTKLGSKAVVFELDRIVGGIAQTANYKGYRFDIGGHRFFTKVPLVQDIWEEILEEDLLERPRLSRIYYKDRFFDYPLRPLNALRGLGAVESVRIGASYLRATLFPSREERTLEQWVTNRFGRRLFEIFFKTYTEKVWGIPCSEIGAEWAAQRIKNLDLVSALKNALLGSRSQNGEVITTLIDKFYYPRLGPGMMWERCADIISERGVSVVLNTEVVRVHHDGMRVTAVTVRGSESGERREAGAEFLSSMPIRTLLNAFDPPPPSDVLAAANRLRYRDFLTVVLVVDRERVFPDNWIYIHSPKVKVGRIQNFKNWSPDMVPDPSRTALGLEYFVQEGDDVWAAADEDLVALGRRECAALGLVKEEEVVDGTVIRMPKAYPVYDGEYQAALAVVRDYVERFPNLQLIGRNGQHRYNNQDHSMVTAVYAARRIHGHDYDIWDVNVDAEYHEQVREERDVRARDRAVPARAAANVTAQVIRSAFSRYDPVALGVAVGSVLAAGLGSATAVLLLKGGDVIGPNLSLLGNYLLGYTVTWKGALVGLVQTWIIGFAFGFVLAVAINVVVGWHETAFRRKLEMMRTLD